MAATPYQTTDTLVRAYDLTAVATTAPTATTPYGFSQAQATAIITQLNLIITLLQKAGTSAVS